MKKKILSILLISALTLGLASCTKPGGNGNGTGTTTDKGDGTDPSQETHLYGPGKPSHDFSQVDVTTVFKDFYVNDFDKPWGTVNELRMASGNIDNYFIYLALDGNNNQLNENLNVMSTVTSPRVKVYAADEPGYIIYEVKYEQLIPIYSKQPSSGVRRSLYFYHNVCYVDYYSGTMFPTVNLTPDVDSFGITGNVIYKGNKYKLGVYEYREREDVDKSASYSGSDTIVRHTIKLKSTTYFVVPEWYDGILMCVYVANDTNRPASEILSEGETANLEEPTAFGEEDNINDYVFFGITGPT